MKSVFIRISLFFLLNALLLSCAPLDNYMLGKDNTPTPEPLTPLKSNMKIQERWSVPVGKSGSQNAYLKLKPVVRNNVIYTADTAGTVDAIDKTTGKLLWSKTLNIGLLSGPSVKQGYIALGTNRSSIILLKQADGSEVWQSKISSDALSKPLIADNKVIVKAIDGNLYALNIQNGETLWASDHGAPHLILKASSSPVLKNNLILVGFADGKLAAVELDTGRTLWERGIAYANGASDVERLVDIDADPVIEGDVVYLATYQGYIGAMSMSDGQFLWRKPASIYKNIARDGNTLYVTDSDDVVWAIDRHNGQVKWKQVSLKARGLTEPVLVGKHLLVADKTGLLHVLGKQNGQLIGRKQLNGPVDIAPAVSNNELFVITANGKLSSLTIG